MHQATDHSPPPAEDDSDRREPDAAAEAAPMKPVWRGVALFLVTLACAIGALVAAGLEEERPESGAVATAP